MVAASIIQPVGRLPKPRYHARMQTRLSYPQAPTADQVDDYHGERVADPYRPLEDSDAPETRAWIEAQNALAEEVLEGASARAEIRERLAEVWDHPRAGAPWRRGDHWFQLRNTGLQDQDVLWVSDVPGEGGRVLIDPNRLSSDGTTALTAVEVSEDGELVAYATSDAGSDWRTWRVRRTADRRGPAGPHRLEQVRLGGVGARWRRIRVWPLPGAAGGRRVRRPEPQHGAAVPPPRRRRIGRPRPAGGAGGAGVGLRADRDGRRPAARRQRLARYRSRQPRVRGRSRRGRHGRCRSSVA